MPSLSPAHAALGAAVRHYRSRLGVSQEELAWRAGVHRTYLGGIERGERNPSFGNVMKLCDALGVKLSELASYLEAQLA